MTQTSLDLKMNTPVDHVLHEFFWWPEFTIFNQTKDQNLAHWIWRRFFKVVNVFLLFHFYLPLKEGVTTFLQRTWFPPTRQASADSYLITLRPCDVKRHCTGLFLGLILKKNGCAHQHAYKFNDWRVWFLLSIAVIW